MKKLFFIVLEGLNDSRKSTIVESLLRKTGTKKCQHQ
jgi:hypothetical protein